MYSHYMTILKDSDKRVRRSLAIQITDSNDQINYGGFRDSDSLVESKFAIYRMTTMMTCYMNQDSYWYQNSDLYNRILLAINFISRSQRENGFFDLNNCNFYSAPDTAFCVKRLLPVYCYMKNNSTTEQIRHVRELVENIIIKAADAMNQGGFHTPNHRWAIASVMMFCSVLFDNASYSETANRYLLEGIDCNEDGEYSERSAGNYNRICNDAMILLSVALKNDSYLNYVERNLEMMMNYIEPDDSIFTNNSTRQDRGVKLYPKDYYFEYLYLGNRLNRPDFLAAANYIMDIVHRHNLSSMDCLIHYMNCPELIGLETDKCSLPTVYGKYFLESGLVRKRNNNYSYSLVKNSPAFFYFQHGDLAVGIRIGASFCEHRYFIPQDLKEVSSSSYLLSQTMVGWYYLPFTEKPSTTDWWSMKNDTRDKLLGPDLSFTVKTTEIENGIDFHIITEGIDKAPLRIELAFDAGARIDNESFTIEGLSGAGILAKSGIIKASKGEYSITAGPAFAVHDYTAGKFGSAGRNPNCFTVYFTDLTCFDHTISLRALPSEY